MAAKDDARCQAAWAANRLRFFAPFLTHLSGPAANPEPRCAEMNGTGVVDSFLGTFTQYIDSGFGLLAG